MKIKRLLLKQYNIGPWFGGLKNLYTRALVYQGMISIFLVALTAYNTLTLREEFRDIANFINFPIFIAVLFCLLVAFMVFAYKVEMPSSIAFANIQAYKHQNLIRKQIAEMKKEHKEQLDLILEKLEELEKQKGQ